MRSEKNNFQDLGNRMPDSSKRKIRRNIDGSVSFIRLMGNVTGLIIGKMGSLLVEIVKRVDPKVEDANASDDEDVPPHDRYQEYIPPKGPERH